jgi:hypothetical protein
MSGPKVTLTPEERTEAERFLCLLASQGDDLRLPNTIADDFKHCMIAWSVIGRAECFAIQEDWPAAAAAAAKACAIFPHPIYFYDFACILRNAGKTADARMMFTEFLRRIAQPKTELDIVILAQRDVVAEIDDARHATAAPLH